MTLAALHARIRATEITAWPSAVRDHAFVQPALSLTVKGPLTALAVDGAVPDSSDTDLFPKLGAKSWQETGRLRIIPAGLPLEGAVAARLATPTRQHVMLHGAWPEGTLRLHLFPARDMTRVTEARYLVSGKMVARASLCLRGPGAEAVVAAKDAFAVKLAVGAAERLGMGSVIVQVAFEPDGRTSILDINPALTPAEVALLDQVPQ
jgi:hypothetical protein